MTSKPKPTLSPTESQIQMSFCDYVAKVRPESRDAIIKIKNEGKLSWQKGKQNKREGLCKGAADIFVAIPTTEHSGLWMEFKTKTGKVSKEQAEFGVAQILRGYGYVVVRSVDEAIEALEDYLRGGGMGSQVMINELRLQYQY
jgi:hypothetical protein